MYEQARATGQLFAAVILDHTIPGGVGGVDTMTRLWEHYPHVKALISSGYANGPVMARWAESGFRGVIPKPYTRERLQEALARLFQEREGLCRKFSGEVICAMASPGEVRSSGRRGERQWRLASRERIFPLRSF